jgi:selenide,water dikinase
VAGKIEMYGVDDVIGQLLCDPQTSGGLLAAIAPEDVESYSQACRQRGVAAAVIGRVVVGSAGTEVIRGGLG